LRSNRKQGFDDNPLYEIALKNLFKKWRSVRLCWEYQNLKDQKDLRCNPMLGPSPICHYKGISLTIKCILLGLYRRSMTRAIKDSVRRERSKKFKSLSHWIFKKPDPEPEPDSRICAKSRAKSLHSGTLLGV
jgi:hypothetical protein